MTYTIRVPHPGIRVSHAYGAYQRQNSHFQATPYAYCLVPYAYQPISYAYCLVPYAYDQRPQFQVCHGFSATNSQIYTSTIQFFIHFRSFYQLQLRYIQLLKSLTLLHLIPTNFIDYHSISFIPTFHRFSAYINPIRGKTMIITTQYILSYNTL
jgi:hypothetical protein